MYKATKDFYSISLKQNFKKGDTLKEDTKIMDAWVKAGNAVKTAKPKRQTKEQKNTQKNK